MEKVEKKVQVPNEKYQYLVVLVGNYNENGISFLNSNLKQLLFLHYYVCTVSLQSICFGIACGWSSPNIPLLKSDETPLSSGKITMDEGIIVFKQIYIMVIKSLIIIILKLLGLHHY